MKTLSLAAKLVVMLSTLVFPLHIAKSTEIEPSKYTQKDLICLAKNIYHEARGESFKGKLAVAQVTINRATHPTRWPSTICKVVYQTIRGVPQFSWTTENLKVVDKQAWQESQHVAHLVLMGDFRLKDFDYTFFHNKTVYFGQQLKHKIIGNHIFYKH